MEGLPVKHLMLSFFVFVDITNFGSYKCKIYSKEA